ncbi:hypothetical protein [Enhygromyxa salina]|uniref:Uncharacterized protein n=1 Tax=Enhygromyxa salina TaxID=215803 RepID=A0A2S9YU62_9BACT|nr:hypothetical protein [Enhygromyxa salina]PRQ08647.1 hypothetical protein ENSA7_16530 [Enhygromyxa salina]
MELVPHYVDSEQAVGCVGPVVIRIIASAPTEITDIDDLVGLVDDTFQRWSAVGIWVVAHHGAPVPDSSVRRYVADRLQPYNDHLTMVCSMLGLGFWASAASGASTGIGVLLGVDLQMTTSVAVGAERMCRELVGLDPARLVAAHDDLMQRITA